MPHLGGIGEALADEVVGAPLDTCGAATRVVQLRERVALDLLHTLPPHAAEGANQHIA